MLNSTAPIPLRDPTLFRQACLVGGKWIEAASGKVVTVRNPADGSVVGTVPALGAAETRQAIEAASAALPVWRKMLAKERATILRRLFTLMLENTDDLAAIMTAEQGKPLTESKGEIAYAASFIEWFAEEGKRVYGDVIPSPMQGRRIIVMKEPIGVFAAITPWNFPAAMITRKAGPGWAAGCTGVIRPASQTPFSALALGVLAERAGMPAGVCNIVTGPAGEVGGELTANPAVRKLSFTGSTEVGAKLLAQCAPTIKKTSMELGGNAPFIVFDDADLDAAVTGAIASKFRNTGQTCVCANRLLVQDGVYDAFAAKLKVAVDALKVGGGMEDGVTLGPLINADAVAKVEEHIADALGRGARVVTGGKRHARGGNFFEPTILADVPADALVAGEETFGPVAPLFRFKTEAEAIAMANDTPFGLAAYFYARDVGRIFRVADALESGIIGINEGIISTEDTYWGGTCVNVGCVPKKIMVQASEYGRLAEDARGFGWDNRPGTHDWAALIRRKDAEITRLNGIYGKLLGGAGVTMFEAHARFTGPHTLAVGDRVITAERIVIATGGTPSVEPAIEGMQLGITSDQAFHLPAMPRRVLMVGGGYIAVEFAGLFRGLGAEVDLVFRQHLPLRGFDHELREELAHAMQEQGIRLHPSQTVHAIAAQGNERQVTLTNGHVVTADLVFFAVGRKPRTRGLGLELAGVAVNDRGAVVVDGHNATNQPHIFAVGDVSNQLNLTPIAIAEGHHLADRLFGPPPPRSWSFAAVPTAVFSSPPIATVGLSEESAAARGPVDVYVARFTPMRHVMSGRPGKTLMKMIVDQASQVVLGVHMLGDDVAEMMQGIGVALTAGATKADFDRTIGIHPTSAEEFVTLRTRTRVAGERVAAE